MPLLSPRVAALAAAALASTAAPALAGTLTYALSPPYQEGVNGANGWYNQAVTVTYGCSDGVALDCPATERLPAGNGTFVPGPVTRTATFTDGTSASVALESAPGVPLRIDTDAPPPPAVTSPAGGVPVFDAGSDVRAAFTCAFGARDSGPAPAGACVGALRGQPGAVLNGERLDTGAPDQPATYGRRVFTVVATDAAGNRSRERSVAYTVDELPGAPGVVDPAPGQLVSRRPVLRWTAPPDDGSGFEVYLVRVSTSTGIREYEVGDAGSSVAFTVPETLPLGAATWTITFRDVRGRTGTTTARGMTVTERPPPDAPRVTTAPVTTTEPRPLFGWQAAEAGGNFEWQVIAVGRVVQAGTTPALTVRVPDILGPGPYAFRVRQVTDVGGPGPWSAETGFTVLAAPASPPPSATPARVVARFVPATRNARLLRPRAGARLATRRPLLSWRRVPRASLYNVQIFRVEGRRFVKVLSAFPRATRYRVPPRRLVAGRRYVLRVWPYMGAARRYTLRPLGTTWFDVRATARR